LKETTRCAEAEYIENLKERYTAIVKSLKRMKRIILEEKMVEGRKRADNVEDEEHRTMLMKIRDNIVTCLRSKLDRRLEAAGTEAIETVPTKAETVTFEADTAAEDGDPERWKGTKPIRLETRGQTTPG
jgi:hypothetical protein